MPKPNDAPPKGRPSDDDIAKRAYELYLQRGSLPGYEIDDWLQAEAELTASASRAEAAPDEARPSDGEPAPSSSRRSGRREAASPSAQASGSTSTSSRRSLRQ